MVNFIERQTLTDVWADWLKDFREGYFVTLNSKIYLESKYDPNIHQRISILKPKVKKVVGHLNEYCYGRKYLRSEQDAELRCLAFFEVGAEKGMLHAHLVAAHNGSTNRSIVDVQRFINRKWKTQYQYSGDTKFVDVAPIGTAKDRIWYCTKQSELFQRKHGDGNIEPI